MGFADSGRQHDNERPDDSFPLSLAVATHPDTKLDRAPRPARRRPLYTLVRSLTFWFALCAGATVASGLLHLLNLGALIVMTALLLLLQSVPISWTRGRPLTFVAPVVFACLLWVGVGVAVWSALLSHFLLSRLRPLARPNVSRVQLRFQGAQLALSALIAARFLWWGERSGHAIQQLQAALAWSNPSLLPTTLLLTLCGAALAALAFLAVSLILTALADPAVCHPELRGALRHTLLQKLWLYGMGLLPLTLLAPLGATIGIAVGLPALFLVLAGAQVMRLTAEVFTLRSELRAAEEMGRASVADPYNVEPNAFLERFLILSRELVKADRAVFWLMNAETGELSPTVAQPNRGPFARKVALYGDGLIGHAATRTRPRLVPDAACDPHRGQRETASGAWLLYPIVVHDQVLGVAQWARQSGHPFTLEDIARLDTLVPQATIALENIRIRARMHHLAATDGLTGLWNQRKMTELLRDELRRAQRYQRVLSILMLDVDSFKAFNDTYGHPQGDHLLRSIATILSSNIRAVDHVGRYGGEEFLILLPETTKDDACRLAERIRGAVEERSRLTVDGETVHRTISVGVASYPEDALNPTELVERADEALYRAKRSGKNRVIWA
jgi:diguanylate cyclase (GGDEF)-like protein